MIMITMIKKINKDNIKKSKKVKKKKKSLLTLPWLFSLSNNSFFEIFLARSISFRTNLELYPLSKRNRSKSLQRLSKELVSEQMRFNLKA